MKKALKNYKKFILNKFKYIYIRSRYLKNHLPLIFAFRLIYELISTELKFFLPKFKSAKYQNYSFSKNMIKDSSRPTYYENEYLFDEMDSFSLNVFNWEKFFNTSKLRYKSLKYLEIGCFEGRSSVYVLENLKNAYCYFVDPFKEYYEMTESTNQNNYVAIYKNFLSNVNKFPNRYEIFKTTSKKFFETLDTTDKFDFIYIDGSHLSEDVYLDFLNADAHIDSNGYIVFDDFFWSWYPTMEDNPFFGITKFLYENRKKYKIIYLGEQLIIKKRS